MAQRRPHERGAAGLRRDDLPDGRRAGAGRGRRPLASGRRPRAPWWDWDHAKLALEWLFCTGRVTARRRVNDFARLYDLPERMLPPAVLAAADPDRAGRPQGAAACWRRGRSAWRTLRDLADYHRQHDPRVAARWSPSWSRTGGWCRCTVEGWKEPAYLHPEARCPARVRARALLSPFDSLVWERTRVERLFGFHYRIEIYTPAPKRRYGYYVLPFLLGDELVGRVDLKADRAAVDAAGPGRLRWSRACPTALVAEELAEELALMAGWLGLERVVVEGRGELAPALRAAVGVTGSRPPRLSRATPTAARSCHGSARKAGRSVTRSRATAGRGGAGAWPCDGRPRPGPSARRAAGRRRGCRPRARR